MSNDPINHAFIESLTVARTKHRFPPQITQAIPDFLDRTMGLLFPHLSHNLRCNPLGVELEIEALRLSAQTLLGYLPQVKRLCVKEIADRFIEDLPNVYRLLLLDAEAIYKGDPAAESLDEIIVAYPGFYAIAVYRISHLFYGLKVPLVPRLLTELAHRRTGIDIHPGASIGESFFIDHGTGIVIGETTQIGDNVKVYQGVTLGALSVSRKLTKKKRHPTIGHNVVIYAGATILGGDTVVGDDTVVGGNVWLTESVPARSVVLHNSDISVRSHSDGSQAIEYHL